MPAFLPLFESAEGLVNGEGFRVENLLLGAQMVAAPGPPLLGPPEACRSHPAAVLSRAVGPNYVPAVPFLGCVEGGRPLLDDDLAWKAARRAPLLRLCGSISANSGSLSEACREV